jgi:hypothetical protein
MLVHQLLLSPVFGIGTTDSVAVETMKKEYRRLSAIGQPTADEQSQPTQLTEALKDLPDWSVVPERDVRQQELLGAIRAALDRQPGIGRQSHRAARPARKKAKRTKKSRKTTKSRRGKRSR